MTDQVEKGPSHFGPCVHCGHLRDEHGENEACLRAGCRGNRYACCTEDHDAPDRGESAALDRGQIESSIRAIRGQRDFFRAIDMAVAADHCEQTAIGYEGMLLDLGWREPAQGIAREVPAIEDIIRRRIADELDTVAMSQAYRLSGHSGVSVTRLRDRAEELRRHGLVPSIRPSITGGGP